MTLVRRKEPNMYIDSGF